MEKGAYLLRFSARYRYDLNSVAEGYGRFSTALPNAEWRTQRLELFLLGLGVDDKRDGDAIDRLAVARRKLGPRNTRAFNVEFDQFVRFEPIRVSELLAAIPEKAASTVGTLDGERGLWFPPEARKELLAALGARRPGIVPALEELWARINAKDPLAPGTRIQKLALQRDAIGLSLDIAGMSDLRRQTFRRTPFRPTEDPSASFIDMMDNLLPQERALIEHDRSMLEQTVAIGKYKTMDFSSGNRNLRVWTVDRGDIEKYTGVDLVLYNHDYKSLLLVQYKCMTKQHLGREETWTCRPDDQFHLQLDRMKNTVARIEGFEASSPKLEDTRLGDGALYFKLCKKLPLSQQDGELADGMFMDVDFVDKFLKSPEAQGPRGGSLISYENCERYLNNSLFCALARDGWIGTSGLTEAQMKELVGYVTEGTDRSFVVAEAKTYMPEGAPASARRQRSH